MGSSCIDQELTQGALHKVGYAIFASSFGNILKKHVMESAQQRGKHALWNTFPKALDLL
jgi:hypothetical protein